MKTALLKEKKAAYQETMLREYLLKKSDDNIQV